MAEWASGYVTDKAYVHDFCRVQVPSMLALAAWLAAYWHLAPMARL